MLQLVGTEQPRTAEHGLNSSSGADGDEDEVAIGNINRSLQILRLLPLSLS